jgi:hypothetical protein
VSVPGFQAVLKIFPAEGSEDQSFALTCIPLIVIISILLAFVSTVTVTVIVHVATTIDIAVMSLDACLVTVPLHALNCHQVGAVSIIVLFV